MNATELTEMLREVGELDGDSALDVETREGVTVFVDAVTRDVVAFVMPTDDAALRKLGAWIADEALGATP